MSATTCPSCSTSLPDGALFCTSCGHRLESAAAADTAATETAPTETAPPPPPEPAPEAASEFTDPAPTAAMPASEAPAPPPTAPPPPPAASPQPPPAAPQPPAQPWADSATTQVPATPAPTGWSAPPPAQGWDPGSGTQPAAEWGHAPAPDAPASTKSGASPLGGVLGLLGGIVAVVAAFLPWISFEAGGTSTSYSLLKLMTGGDDVPLESSDVVFLLIAGIAAVILAVLVFTTRSKALSGLLIVAGLGMIAVGVLDWMSVVDFSEDLPNTITIDGALGLYLTYAAGAVTAIGGLAGIVLGRKA